MKIYTYDWQRKVERRSKDWEQLLYGTFTACELCYNEKTKI